MTDTLVWHGVPGMSISVRIVNCTARLALVASLVCVTVASAQDDRRVWREFVSALREGKIDAMRICPHRELGENFRATLRGYLDSLKSQAAPEDWTAMPEVVRSGDRLQYITRWGAGERRASYCFSFGNVDSGWCFQHLELIFIRMDTVSHLPTSRFPDIPEVQKSWAREETYWSFIVSNVYSPAAREKGEEYALDLLKDGVGYFLGAKAWVPFTEPHRAFILYLCWEQANLRGNEVTLVRLDDHEAVVRVKTQFFALYFVTAHLRSQITLEAYRKIFETIWRDRAAGAGWNIRIEYSPDYDVTFRFTRGSS